MKKWFVIILVVGIAWFVYDTKLSQSIKAGSWTVSHVKHEDNGNALKRESNQTICINSGEGLEEIKSRSKVALIKNGAWSNCTDVENSNTEIKMNCRGDRKSGVITIKLKRSDKDKIDVLQTIITKSNVKEESIISNYEYRYVNDRCP